MLREREGSHSPQDPDTQSSETHMLPACVHSPAGWQGSGCIPRSCISGIVLSPLQVLPLLPPHPQECTFALYQVWKRMQRDWVTCPEGPHCGFSPPMGTWGTIASAPRNPRACVADTVMCVQGSCYGLNCLPENSYLGVLIPRMSECHLIWKQGHCRCNS